MSSCRRTIRGGVSNWRANSLCCRDSKHVHVQRHVLEGLQDKKRFADIYVERAYGEVLTRWWYQPADTIVVIGL